MKEKKCWLKFWNGPNSRANSHGPNIVFFAQLSFCYQSKTFVLLAQILYVESDSLEVVTALLEPDQNRIVVKEHFLNPMYFVC